MICHATATDADFVNNPDLVAALYADYYVDYEPDNAFVLVNENDEAVGYILCAENYRVYIDTFKREQLKKVRKISKKYALQHRLSFIMDRLNGRKYPAHLHIDLLPEAQRQGWGTKLIDTLIAHLKSKGVNGVCLGVGGTNEGGIRFYKKYGFTEFRNFGKAGRVFGMSLRN
jgi:Acetyltransferases